MHIAIAGCGALGSQIAWHIALPGDEFILIDDDRVGAENTLNGTSVYRPSHVGAYKAVVLSEMLYRQAVVLATPDTRAFTDARRHVLADADLVVDCFDNAEARRATFLHTAKPVLHVGVSAGGTGAALWGGQYVIDPNAPLRGQGGVCTHLLGRLILRFTAAVAAGIVDHFRATGVQRAAVVNEHMEVLWL